MGLFSKLRRGKEEYRKRINKFRQDIENKNWGKFLEKLIKERNLEPFEKQGRFTISIFKKYIKDRWGVKVTINEVRWAWEKILENLIERRRERGERRKKREEEEKRIEKKILEDIEINNDEIKTLLSIVEKHKGQFSKGGEEFTNHLKKTYGSKVDKKIAQKIWDKFKIKIIQKEIERDLNNEKIAFEIFCMVYNYRDCWEKISENIKKKFVAHLKDTYGLEIDKEQAGKVWNRLQRYRKKEILRMMQKCISLTKEIAKLGSKKARIRIDAATKLGILQDKRAVRPLIEALNDENILVQGAAAEALGNIGDPRSLGELRRLKKTLDNQIQKFDNQIVKLENGKDNYVRKYVKYHFVEPPPGDITISQYKETIKNTKEIKKLCLNVQTTVDLALSKLKEIKFSQMAKVTESKLKEMDWQDFQDRIIEALNGIPSDKKVADMGIDGITSNGVPTQIKQSENVGRNVVDNFETALRRYYPSNKKIRKGIIVAFSFTKGAYEEAHRARLEDNIKIDLIAVEELFE